eukprot:g65041.t1
MRLVVLSFWTSLTSRSVHAAGETAESWGGSSYDERQGLHHPRRYAAYGAYAPPQANFGSYGSGYQQAPAYSSQNAGANYGAYGQNTDANYGAYGQAGSGGAYSQNAAYGAYGAYGAYNQGGGGGGAYGAYGNAGSQNVYGAYGNAGSSQNAYVTHGNTGSNNAYGAYSDTGSHNAYGVYGAYGASQTNAGYGNANTGAYGAYSQSQNAYGAYGAYGQSHTSYGASTHGNAAYGAYGAPGAYGTTTCSPSPSRSPSISPSRSPRPPQPAFFAFAGRNQGGLLNDQEVGRSKDNRRRVLAANNSFTWTILPNQSFPEPRIGLGSAVLNNLAYAIGGNNASVGANSITTVARVDRYDPISNNWTRVDDLNVARTGLGAAAAAGKVYAVGGCTGNDGVRVKTTECFNPNVTAQGNWTVVASMNNARENAGVVALNGKVYAFGGIDENQNTLSTAEVYDPINDTWTFIANMKVARDAPAAAVLNGTIYAIGGQDAQGHVLNSTECYDLITQNWTLVGDLNVARMMAQAGTVEGVMYVVGGLVGQAENQTLESTERFNETTQTWTISANLSQPRRSFGLATLTGLIPPGVG